MVDVCDERCPGCGREYLTASRGKTALLCGHYACRQCAIRISQGSEQCRQCQQKPVTSSQKELHKWSAIPRKSGLPVATVTEQQGQSLAQNIAQRSPTVVTREPTTKNTLIRPKSHQGTLPTLTKYDTLPRHDASRNDNSIFDTLPRHHENLKYDAHPKYDAISLRYNKQRYETGLRNNTPQRYDTPHTSKYNSQRYDSPYTSRYDTSPRYDSPTQRHNTPLRHDPPQTSRYDSQRYDSPNTSRYDTSRKYNSLNTSGYDTSPKYDSANTSRYDTLLQHDTPLSPSKCDTLPKKYDGPKFESPHTTKNDSPILQPNRLGTPPTPTIPSASPTAHTHYNTLPTRTHPNTPQYTQQVKQNQKLLQNADDGRQGVEEGQYNVGNLTRRYEHLSNLPQPSTLPNKKELARSRENLSEMRRIRLSKSTSEVDSVNETKTTQNHEIPQNITKKGSKIQYSSTKNLDKTMKETEMVPKAALSNATKRPSPASLIAKPGYTRIKLDSDIARPGYTKLKTEGDIAKLGGSNRMQNLMKTIDSVDVGSVSVSNDHREILNREHIKKQKGKKFNMVTKSSSESQISSKTSNMDSDGEDIGIHIARPVYIVDSSEVLPHRLTPTYGYEDELFISKLRQELEELKRANTKLENELSSCKTELHGEIENKKRLEVQHRSLEEELRSAEREAWRYQEEVGKLKEEEHRDKIEHQPVLHKEIERRILLQQELDMLRGKLSSERGRWEEERSRLEKELRKMGRELSEANEEISRLRAQQERSVDGKEYAAESRGLPNLGNTCYINSVLQCLFTIIPLRIYFTTEKHKSDLNAKSEQLGEVAMAFGAAFSLMETGSKPDGTMKDFQMVVWNHDPVFEPGLQQDAHDLLASLLLWLHNDLTTTSQGNNKNVMGIHGSVSIISRLFHGHQESIITCPNTKKILSATREFFNNLTLVVPDSGRCSLGKLLERHYRTQEVDWECMHCGFNHNCTYQSRLLALPDVLIIHFSRSEATGNSIKKTRVSYPLEGLTLENLLTHKSGYWPVYELVGVVNHSGTMSGGHYTAFCRSGTGNWWLWDDTELQEATVVQVSGQQQDAHILFYHVVDDSSV